MFGDKAGKANLHRGLFRRRVQTLLPVPQSSGALETCAPDPKGIAIRGKVEGAMFKLGDEWRHRDFSGLGTGKDRLKLIMTESAKCVKCLLSCVEACPILLLCRVLYKETLVCSTWCTADKFHVPPDPVCPCIGLLCQLRPVRGTLPDGDTKRPVHALTADRDREDVRSCSGAGIWRCHSMHW